jgi:hypothetical protein
MPDAHPPSVENPPTADFYESDFYAWTQAQAALLRERQWNHLDLPNLIEEIESLGKRERQELRNRFAILIGHLLKWEYQPQKRSRSWLLTIQIQRSDVEELLSDNPSLKPYLKDGLPNAYVKAVKLAAIETQLPTDTFPLACPYRLDEILSDRFYPGSSSDLVDPA